MKIDRKLGAARWVVLLVVAGGAATAGAAEAERNVDVQSETTTALTDADTVAGRGDACVGADCTAPAAVQSTEAFNPDVLPKLSLPALLGTESTEDRC